MKRRDFINWVGLGLLASSLPVAIAACSDKTATPEPKSSPVAGWQKVGTSAELDKTGQLVANNSPVGPVLVVGKSKSANLIAVNPTCTHKGCTVTWKEEGKKFTCPCHKSEFAADGKVLKGPADKPLKTYAAKIEGDSVVVKSS
ncbi:Rieske [2Fe-2S] domain-containing protein [Calothrix sp. NIES-2100]|uniref:QcrA and Rieske domain-containing protein n=1 Tax=Calothrix sp. NIES-2100 TaxID=1954172 RepID=UPI000B5EA2AB|nr:Rieske [2Fe-2S] domain-containing protein [Calothrix sp. NIES-2100]